MLGFIIRRLLWLIPVLWFVATITFTLMHMVPGGPWDREKKLPEAMQRALNERYGLDQPLAMQYVSYLANAVRGDLGLTYSYQDRPVAEV
ncbi:MAG: ABC transporter permease, partial [Chloroflexi bacterium]|nr:ABC transporter permease [Chloroflexota bacterium]